MARKLMARKLKTSLRYCVVGPVAVLTASCQPAAQTADPVSLEGDIPQASYSLGYTVASNVNEQFAGGLNNEAFLTGIRDAMTGVESQVNEEQAQAAMAALAQKQQEAAAVKADSNLDVGARFLAENGAREGVVTTASGLQYEVITAAEGPKPGPTDTVTTHYHGTLIDGTVFDSSLEREPASFPLNGVIPGWTEALQLMSVGAKYRLYLPADLAYGSRGTRGIQPNSALIFEVELLEIAE
jgi:FKBP-type peptidyl-prolyl cis-trans isomerase FklB